MKRLGLILMLVVLSASAMAKGVRCVYTYNRDKQAIERNCQSDVHMPAAYLTKNDEKALKEGRANSCVAEIIWDETAQKYVKSSSCR